MCNLSSIKGEPLKFDRDDSLKFISNKKKSNPYPICLTINNQTKSPNYLPKTAVTWQATSQVFFPLICSVGGTGL